MYLRSLVLGIAWCCVFAHPLLAQSTGEMQTLSGWNVRYEVPAEWTLVRAEGRLRVFQDAAGSTTLFVAPGVSATPAEIQNDLIALGSALGLQGRPTQELHATSVRGRDVVDGEYELFSPATGQRALGRSVTVLSEGTTTVGMVVLAPPEDFAAASASLERMVTSVHIESPTPNQAAVAGLAGRWTYYSGSSSPSIANSGSYSRSYEETVSFDGQGRFEFTSSSHVAASSSHSSDGSYSDVSSIGGGNAQGTYTVIGNSIVVTGEQGRAVYDYAMRGGDAFVSGGKTYIRGG